MHWAGGGCSGRETTCSRPRRRSRAGWRCIRPATGDGPRAVDRPALRRRGLRLVVPGPRRGADRRRLVRPARPGQAADAAAGRGRRRIAGWLPGQLDPAPAPARGRGRRVLRRRQRRALPAADRRGHPDGVLLRDRARARAARRARGPPGPRRRAGALRRVLGVAQVEVRGDVRRPAVDPAPARAAAGQRSRACSRARACLDWAFGTTWRSRRRPSPSPHRRAGAGGGAGGSRRSATRTR